MVAIKRSVQRCRELDTNLLAKMQALQEENKALSENVQMLMNRCEKLESQVNMMYNWRNERNMVIRMKKGVSVEAEIKRVVDMCADLSGNQNILSVNDVRSVSGREGPTSILLASFSDASKVQSVLQNARRLKGCDISLSRDYPKEVRIKRGQLLNVRKLVLAKAAVKMTLRNDILSDGEVSFKWGPEGLALVSGGNVSEAMAKYGLTMDFINLAERSRRFATGRRTAHQPRNQQGASSFMMPAQATNSDGQAPPAVQVETGSSMPTLQNNVVVGENCNLTNNILSQSMIH